MLDRLINEAPTGLLRLCARRAIIQVLLTLALYSGPTSPVFSTTSHAGDARRWVFVAGSKVHLHAVPEPTSELLGSYDYGIKLELLERRDGWILVRHPRSREAGWVNSEHVELVPAPRQASRQGTHFNAASRGANLRSQHADDRQLRSNFTRKQRLLVYGDSLATNLFHGLQSYASRARFYHVRRRTRGATGLIRDDQFDWYAHTLRNLKNDRPDVLIVTLGGNDRQDIYSGRQRIPRFTRRWWSEYRRRVDRYMSALKRYTRHVYWLGLPVVRSRRMTKDYAKFNRLYLQLAARHGINYVDTWNAFQAPGGGYTAYGRDVDGRYRQLRNRDGIHFNQAGNMALAKLVIRAIRRASSP